MNYVEQAKKVSGLFYKAWVILRYLILQTMTKKTHSTNNRGKDKLEDFVTTFNYTEYIIVVLVIHRERKLIFSHVSEQYDRPLSLKIAFLSLVAHPSQSKFGTLTSTMICNTSKHSHSHSQNVIHIQKREEKDRLTDMLLEKSC